MVRARYRFESARVAVALVAAFGAFGAGACSSSTAGTPASDGGDDGTSYLTPETGAGAGDGASGGGGDASDAATCNMPAAATYSYDGGSGGFNCYPVGQDPTNCDAASYLLRCLASDPYNTPPSQPAALKCNTMSIPTSMAVETEFCCACM